MAYGDDWECEFTDCMHRWAEARWRQELYERELHPDE
jgi:hypothetical protein